MGANCSSSSETTSDTFVPVRAVSNEPTETSESKQQIQAMAEQIIFLSTQNARLTQQLEEANSKLGNIDSNKDIKINQNTIELFCNFETNYIMQKYDIKIDKNKERVLTKSITEHIINIYHLDKLANETQNILHSIFDNLKDELIIDLIFRIEYEGDLMDGKISKILAKIILKKLFLHWKTQTNPKIALSFVHQIAQAIEENNGINIVNVVVKIIENENSYVTECDKLYAF